jgi:hypothetical protein
MKIQGLKFTVNRAERIQERRSGALLWENLFRIKRFQVDIWRTAYTGCPKKKWHYRNDLIVLKPLLNARDYTPGNWIYI